MPLTTCTKIKIEDWMDNAMICLWVKTQVPW